jgi:hypothetical protein
MVLRRANLLNHPLLAVKVSCGSGSCIACNYDKVFLPGLLARVSDCCLQSTCIVTVPVFFHNNTPGAPYFRCSQGRCGFRRGIFFLCVPNNCFNCGAC